MVQVMAEMEGDDEWYIREGLTALILGTRDQVILSFSPFILRRDALDLVLCRCRFADINIL